MNTLNSWPGQSKPVKNAYKIKNRKSRKALPESTNPFYVAIKRGLALGYRKNETKAGTWSFRRFANKRYEYHVPDAVADDNETKANGETVLSYQEAVAAAIKWDEQQASVDSGGIVSSGAYTVKDAVEDYLKDKETEKRKPLYRDRVTAKAHIYPTLGAIQLRKLKHIQVKAWRDALAEPQTKPRVRTRKGKQQATRKTFNLGDSDALRKRQATANRILSVLKAALNYAKIEKRRVVSDAGWADVKPFKNADREKLQFLSLNEVKRLIPVCEPEFAKLVKGALFTGARYGELTRVHVEHFNESETNVFIAESKSGEARHIYLNSDAVAFFKSITQGREPKETIFQKDGRSWRQSEQFRPMNAACEAVKIENVTFHTLRHTYASQARMAGMPLDVLKEQLGHADLRMTLRYAKIGKTHQQKQVQQFAPTFSFEAA